MKKFCIFIIGVIAIITIGMNYNVTHLYSNKDSIGNIYLESFKDEHRTLEMKKRIYKVLDKYGQSLQQEDIETYMTVISKDYRDDQTRNYSMLKQAMEEEFRKKQYERLDYQVDLFYPSLQGIWVRTEKTYTQDQGKGNIVKEKEIQDMLFVLEKGEWKIKQMKKVSSLI